MSGYARGFLAARILGAVWLAFAAFASTAAAQGTVKGRIGVWDTRCETPPGAAGPQCAIVQTVVDQERPNITLVVIVLKTADRKSRLLRVVAPLGVLLPPGLGLKVDNEDLGHMTFARCQPTGCVAEVFVDDRLLDRLEHGKTATFVLFETPEEGVGVPAPLDGFKPSFEALP